MVVIRENRFLMIKRAAGVLAPGAWCFVGGGMQPGETQAETARREFREEVGADVRPLRKIWEYDHPDGKLRLHWWLAELQSPELTPNPAEVAEFRWLRPEEILALPGVLPGNVDFLRSIAATLLPAS